MTSMTFMFGSAAADRAYAVDVLRIGGILAVIAVAAFLSFIVGVTFVEWVLASYRHRLIVRGLRELDAEVGRRVSKRRR